MKDKIIIVGAGAAGLQAAADLVAAGKNLVVLEARDRMGGRIHTMTPAGFSMRVEAGAEFIHGKAKITDQLIKDAAAKTFDMKGNFYELHSGSVKESSFENEDWDTMVAALQKLHKDVSIKDFMDQHFPQQEFPELYDMVMKFVMGFDAADPKLMSAFACRDEWSETNQDDQPRIKEGYQTIIDELAKDPGHVIRLNNCVKEIEWTRGHVRLLTAAGDIYEGSKLLITVPLGLLQRNEIEFKPSLANLIAASREIGYGAVIKFIFEVDRVFWSDVVEKRFGKFRFIFSDAEIPTWSSQRELSLPIITGWLGGPKAFESGLLADEELLEKAIYSLSYILKCATTELRKHIRAQLVANWVNDPLSRGAYSYSMVDSDKVRKMFAEPVEDTIFFAGEALYRGGEMGTVEAALASGKEMAKLMRK